MGSYDLVERHYQGEHLILSQEGKLPVCEWVTEVGDIQDKVISIKLQVLYHS